MMKLRYAIYVRVSTARQDQHDLSIPDQLKQARKYIGDRGGEIVAEYADRGITGTEDRRPQFQRMIEAASIKPAAFDVILVHSLSRFFRDPIMSEVYQRRLKKYGVRIESITQSFADDPTGNLARQVVALFDQYQSLETAKHVTRCLRANAEQGFWNGTRPPFGYKSVVAEQRGEKSKKKLVIDEAEAALFHQVKQWALEGDGQSGRLGAKAIAKKLNDMGLKTREGKRFYVSFVHRMLSDECYTGKFTYARNTDKPVTIKIPELISEEEFLRVRAIMAERRPDVTPPRFTTSNVLLSGLAICASCDRPLMIRSGKNKQGSTYRYYCCSGKLLNGSCEGGKPSSIREDELDEIVMSSVINQLLTPERTQAIVNAVADRRGKTGEDTAAGLSSLRGRASQQKRKIDNIVDALASGHLPKELAQEKLKSLTMERAATLALIEAAQSAQDRKMRPIALAEADLAAARLRSALLAAPVATKKRYLRAIVDQIVVAPKGIAIVGPEDALAELAAEPPSTIRVHSVHSSAREWR